MARNNQTEALASYVRDNVKARTPSSPTVRAETLKRIEKAFSLLPEDVLELFLSAARSLTVVVAPDQSIPFGMSTTSQGPSRSREYVITIHEENQNWPEDLFIGSFLRELGHVVAQRPPENEWPQTRGDRARYKERLEYVADAMVWRWGLRHYSIRHLTATYPEHWVERIVDEIGKVLLEENAPT
jgi:hypothetical protein